MEGFLWGGDNGGGVVRGAMCTGSSRGGAGSDADVRWMSVRDVWVSASEWAGDRATVYGEFITSAGDNGRVFLDKEEDLGEWSDISNTSYGSVFDFLTGSNFRIWDRDDSDGGVAGGEGEEVETWANGGGNNGGGIPRDVVRARMDGTDVADR